MRIRCAIDLDGVLGNFNSHVQNVTGSLPDDLGDDLWPKISAHVMSGNKFWTEIQILPGAHDIIDMCRPYGVRILTGCPRTNFDIADREKREWAHAHFPGVPVITCLSKDKYTFIESPGDLLLDDNSGNIKKWIKAGGVGIRYKTFEQAYSDLESALKSRTW